MGFNSGFKGLNVARKVIKFQSTSVYVNMIMQHDAKCMQFVGV